jgi:hypothetical protein
LFMLSHYIFYSTINIDMEKKSHSGTVQKIGEIKILLGTRKREN